MTARTGGAVESVRPTVSIVTPSYNQGPYIEETIRSVLGQESPGLEYIVVDGGSTDDTLEILRKYEAHLRWLSEKDRGQADAINKGFRAARGEILGWLNSDDTYLPGAIRKVVEYFRTHPDVDMVYGEGYHVDEGGEVIERYSTEPFDRRRLAEVCFICQPAAFFRARVFREVGPLDASLSYALDYDYWMRIAARCRIGHLNEYLANSRLHRGTKTLSRPVEVHAEILRTVRKHYGRVPTRWIVSSALVYLTERLMPNPYHIEGIYPDGWASPRVRLLLREEWKVYARLSLKGRSSAHAAPLRLRTAVGNQIVNETLVEGTTFALTPQLWPNGVTPAGPDTVEVQVHADTCFVPQALGLNDDRRRLSYRIRELSLVDAKGRELVVYSRRKEWLFDLALPALLIWTSLRINHRVPWGELSKWWSGCVDHLQRYLSRLVR